MKKVHLFFLAGFLFLLLIASCTKESINTNEFVESAKEVLKKDMSSSAFASLKWNSISVSENKRVRMIQIPLANENEFIIFGEVDGNKSYYKIESNLKRSNRDIVGQIKISDVKNNPLTLLSVTGDKVKSQDITRFSSGVETALGNDPVYQGMDEITIIAYINTSNQPSISPMTWVSLYWLFNMNNAYVNLYTNNEFVDPDNSNGTLPIVDEADLYPETPEILAFEAQYIYVMSERERSIYLSMTRAQQLAYLHNAQIASKSAEALFPANQLVNGKGDAFRHALFHALNARSIGEALTKALGDAHELNSNSVLETRMDLFNNQIGINIGLNYEIGPYSPALGIRREIEQIVLAAIDRGDLRYIPPLNAAGLEIPNVSQLKPTNE
ncbi:MAG: hypothetical protein WBP58_15110 [Chitinophagaceae bacterium]